MNKNKDLDTEVLNSLLGKTYTFHRMRIFKTTIQLCIAAVLFQTWPVKWEIERLTNSRIPSMSEWWIWFLVGMAIIIGWQIQYHNKYLSGKYWTEQEKRNLKYFIDVDIDEN